MLELFTAKSPSHESLTGEQGLVAWVQACFPTQMIQELLDPELRKQLQEHADDDDDDGYNRRQALVQGQLDYCTARVFVVGLSCTVSHPEGRITMREALHKLKSVRNKLLKS